LPCYSNPLTDGKGIEREDVQNEYDDVVVELNKKSGVEVGRAFFVWITKRDCTAWLLTNHMRNKYQITADFLDCDK